MGWVQLAHEVLDVGGGEGFPLWGQRLFLALVGLGLIYLLLEGGLAGKLVVLSISFT